MKQTKKLISLALVFSLLLCLCDGIAMKASADSLESEHFVYELKEDGTARITDVKDGKETVVVPYAIDGHLVTEISPSGEGQDAFQGQWGTKKVFLPDTVAVLGDRAFATCSVAHVYSYPVSEEMKQAVSGQGEQYPSDMAADSLEATQAPDNAVAGEWSADSVVSGAALAFPQDLSYIGTECFFNSALEEVTIKGAVNTIGDRAFSVIAALQTVTVNETGSVGHIGSYCFQNSGAANFNFYWYGRVEQVGNNAFEGSGGITNFYMQDVGIIGKEAFKNCRIQNVTLKGSLTSIGESAFVGCGNLQKVVIDSKTPYSIGKYAFTCSSIQEVVFSNGLAKVQEGTFSGCGQLSKVYLPESLQEIEKNAFQNVSTITTITINDTAKVDSEAFAGAGGTTLASLDRLNNASVKSIVDKALNRTHVQKAPVVTVKVAKVKLKSVKKNKKKTKVTLKWSRNKKAAGYIVYVKVVKKGKKANKVSWKKVKTIKKNKTTKLTVKLSKSQRKAWKKKAKIYYAVRAYQTQTANGKKQTYYSGYTQKRLK